MANILSKHSIIHGKRVSFVELFYDLIFVFCVSSCVHLAGEGAEGSLQLYSWAVFLFCFLACVIIMIVAVMMPDHPHITLFIEILIVFFVVIHTRYRINEADNAE